VIFLFQLNRHSADYQLIKADGDLASNEIKIVEYWPSSATHSVPDDVPANVLMIYSQALLCMRQDAWDSAGMTFRKTIDVSTKGLEPQLSSKPLAARIDALHISGRLTDDLKAWAHEIRLDGNEATHEEDPFTQDQAESLMQFSDAYLKYIYTLPALVAKNRAGRFATKAA
jgi:hypothetical protein